MNKKIIYLIAFIALFSMVFISCKDDIEPVEEELKLGRVLGPINLVARIRNQTTIELNWTPREGVEQYVVEFSESEDFSTIAHTATITAKDLPYQRSFKDETLYYARVKGVSSNGVPDSKWVVVSIETAPENIFLPAQDGDIEATTAIVRWPSDSVVTHLVISPGNVQQILTEEEKADGVATITGLTGETTYTVVLKRENKTRGSVTFTTLIDIGDATVVTAEDDLKLVIEAAEPGDVLALFPGDYTVFTGAITLNKSISLKGVRPNDKPKLHVLFTLEAGATNVELKDLELIGDDTHKNLFEYKTAGFEYGSLSIIGCDIHNYVDRLVYGNVAAKVESFSIDNSKITDVDVPGGGDFIDFRTTYVASVSLTNSTFDNCAPGRDFIRLDAAGGYSGTTLTSTVLIDHCTFYKVSNTQDRVLYVRFNANVLTVKNSLFAETDGFYSNQSATSQPICSNNNYFNAPGFYTSATGVKIDNSSYTTLDPQFEDAVNGNFKVKNQAVIDNNVGDPRWLK